MDGCASDARAPSDGQNHEVILAAGSEGQRVESIVDACLERHLAEEDALVLAALKTHRRRRLLGSVVLFFVGVMLSVSAWTHQRVLGRVMRGEVTLADEPRYEPAYVVDAETLATIDWAEIHSRLLPAWVIARGQHSVPEADREDRAQRAYTKLRYALAADRNLVELFDEVEEHLRRDPLGGAGRLDYLLWAYNHYLETNDIPWRVEATLLMRRQARAAPTFLTRSYQVLEDLRSPDGYRLRLLRRADLTNVDEGFLGHTSSRDDGALVMLDQVLQFGVHHVWPLLHAGLDGRLPTRSQSLADHVRREALGALDANDYALLHETAVDQQALIEVAASIHSRQRCGNRFKIYGCPGTVWKRPTNARSSKRSAEAKAPNVPRSR